MDKKTSFYNLPTIYFPLGFEYIDKTLSAAAVGAILGDAFSFNYSMASDDLFVLTASGRDIVNAIDSCVEEGQDFAFGESCCGNLVTLGDDIYLAQERIKKKLIHILK